MAGRIGATSLIPYWVLFLVPACAALLSQPQLDARRRSATALVLFGVFLALMIGFRWRVGGDWGFEARIFDMLRFSSFYDAITKLDPGFGLIAWLLSDTGYNVWTINLVCGTIFAFGLITFCRNEPHPWLAITVAVPYLIIVVAMGNSRQSVAIGLAMIALVKLQRRSLVSFNIYMVLAATIHTTAVLLIPLGLIASNVNKIRAAILGGPIFLAAFVYLLQGQVDRFVSGYIDAQYSSQGAYIRVGMSVIPALAFIKLRDRFQLLPEQRYLMMSLSAAAVFALVLLLTTPSSTAVDRMALYLIPLQMMVLGRLPLALAQSWREYHFLTAGVVVYSALILLVWLFVAAHSEFWLPYQLFPATEL